MNVNSINSRLAKFNARPANKSAIDHPKLNIVFVNPVYMRDTSVMLLPISSKKESPPK